MQIILDHKQKNLSKHDDCQFEMNHETYKNSCYSNVLSVTLRYVKGRDGGVGSLPPILGDSGADSGDEEKSKRAEKYMARRKVKNGEKSPWGQCLTRPVPNGRRRSGF